MPDLPQSDHDEAAYIRSLEDLAARLRRAGDAAERRKIYGLAEVLHEAAESADGWAEALRDVKMREEEIRDRV